MTHIFEPAFPPVDPDWRKDTTGSLSRRRWWRCVQKRQHTLFSRYNEASFLIRSWFDEDDPHGLEYANVADMIGATIVFRSGRSITRWDVPRSHSLSRCVEIALLELDQDQTLAGHAKAGGWRADLWKDEPTDRIGRRLQLSPGVVYMHAPGLFGLTLEGLLVFQNFDPARVEPMWREYIDGMRREEAQRLAELDVAIPRFNRRICGFQTF